MVSKQKMDQYVASMKQGFIMGAISGAAVGFVVGGLTVLTSGPAPGKTIFYTIGRSMLQTGGWLGCLLSVGSLMRAEEMKKSMHYRRIPVNINDK